MPACPKSLSSFVLHAIKWVQEHVNYNKFITILQLQNQNTTGARFLKTKWANALHQIAGSKATVRRIVGTLQTMPLGERSVEDIFI